MTVIITRAAEDSSEFIEILTKKGISNYFCFPCLSFSKPEDDYKALDAAIRTNHEFDWLVFLSRRAAESFFSRLLEIGGHFFHLAPHLKIAVIGSGTKEFIENEINFPVDFMPYEFNSDAFAKEFIEKCTADENLLEPLGLLIPRTSIANNLLINTLEESKKIKVTQVDAYTTVKPEISLEQVFALKAFLDNERDPEIKLTFTSSQCVRNFFEITKPYFSLESYQDKLSIYSIGPNVTATLRDILGESFNILQAEKPLLECLLA